MARHLRAQVGSGELRPQRFGAELIKGPMPAVGAAELEQAEAPGILVDQVPAIAQEQFDVVMAASSAGRHQAPGAGHPEMVEEGRPIGGDQEVLRPPVYAEDAPAAQPGAEIAGQGRAQIGAMADGRGDDGSGQQPLQTGPDGLDLGEFRHAAMLRSQASGGSRPR